MFCIWILTSFTFFCHARRMHSMLFYSAKNSAWPHNRYLLNRKPVFILLNSCYPICLCVYVRLPFISISIFDTGISYIVVGKRINTTQKICCTSMWNENHLLIVVQLFLYMVAFQLLLLLLLFKLLPIHQAFQTF